MRFACLRLSRIAISVFTALVVVASFPHTAAPQAGSAQTDPMAGMWVGTWKLNQAKSMFRPGPAPRSVTLTGVANGTGVTVTADSMSAAGAATHAVFTLSFEGKFQPITGTQVADAGALFKTDPYTAEYAYTKDGALVQVGTYRFAMDGRSLTIVTKGISVVAAGQRVDNVVVYDKQ